jgi:RNA polymerase sigma-70 factor (ECF subfamily)
LARSSTAAAARLRLIRGEGEASTPAPPASTVGAKPTAHAARLAELSDASLVALAARGEIGAAEQLYRRHAPFALNLAARIAGSTHDIEDVVHDAFLRAFAELDTLRSPEAFRFWLGSIVVRGMRTRLRRGRFLRLFGLGRTNDPIDLESIASDEAPPAARAELAQIYALLQTIEPDDRIAWTLRFVEGRELGEAADLAGCSLATIKRRIGRAQKFLEDHFVDTGGEEPNRESLP